MLSIQEESLLPPPLAKALAKVRAGADAMPPDQLERQLTAQLGENYMDKFSIFDEVPLAAASIGQVHRGRLKSCGSDVAVKVQYPGVAKSIHIDLSNLQMLVTYSGMMPKVSERSERAMNHSKWLHTAN